MDRYRPGSQGDMFPSPNGCWLHIAQVRPLIEALRDIANDTCEDPLDMIYAAQEGLAEAGCPLEGEI